MSERPLKPERTESGWRVIDANTGRVLAEHADRATCIEIAQKAQGEAPERQHEEILRMQRESAEPSHKRTGIAYLDDDPARPYDDGERERDLPELRKYLGAISVRRYDTGERVFFRREPEPGNRGSRKLPIERYLELKKLAHPEAAEQNKRTRTRAATAARRKAGDSIRETVRAEMERAEPDDPIKRTAAKIGRTPDRIRQIRRGE